MLYGNAFVPRCTSLAVRPPASGSPARRRTAGTAALRRLLLAGLALCGAGALAACGGGGGGGGGGGSVRPGQAASQVSEEHWRTALAALGQNYTPQQPAFDDAALRQWNVLLARAWYGDAFFIQDALVQLLQQELNDLVARNAALRAVRGVTVDIGAAPGFSSTRPDEVRVLLPNPPSTWRVAFVLEVGTQVQTSVLGVPITTTILGDLAVAVEDIRIVIPARFDTSNPQLPYPAQAGRPLVDMRLVLSSSTPLLNQLTATLTSVLDPVVRTALVLGALYVHQQFGGALASGPSPPWGTGGPGLQPVAQPPDLGRLAEQVSDDIVAHHTPFGTVFETRFDQPGYGNGTPVRYHGQGDSTIWTGHYLMAEALRWELTRDPRALAAAEKVVGGLENCLDASPVDGRLSRCAIPASSPHVNEILGGLDFAWGTIQGVPYGTLNDVSRDQYVGVFMGFVQTFLRVPPLRERARRAITRMVSYLDGHDWIAYRTDGVTPARGRYAFTPPMMWAALKAAYLVDPQRWAALHAAHADMARIFWFNAWGSSQEVMSSYYKFNLGHDAITILTAVETDPALYREYIKELEVLRGTIGHHMNAWFDAVYAVAVPAMAPLWGPAVKGELERFALRDRRTHPVDLRNDPSIAKTTYTISVVGAGSPQQVQNGSQTVLVAVHPIPIDKRPYSDFLWQRNPFQLTGGGDPHLQMPGVDLVQPYWVARSYGLFR
ncbi:MAG: hypothetical protein KatS3mg102_2947 [Planctomycetota bacterium]|nr:MAG: hypothetical protein KatS3mg102_2947 [Planctomycetota bacterium]